MKEKKLNGTVIVTYRCNARCTMCNRYKAPSKPDEEISIETIKKLPKMYFTNITGGEPFIREDLPEIVRELYKKSDRIVISTNGFFTDRIIKLCEEFPNVGIRISIEGLEETNNKIRGLDDGFNRGYSTLKKLVEMKHPDVGFGMTVQDANAKDLVPLYDLSNELPSRILDQSITFINLFRRECTQIPFGRPVLLPVTFGQLPFFIFIRTVCLTPDFYTVQRFGKIFRTFPADQVKPSDLFKTKFHGTFIQYHFTELLL